ncbi:MAG: MaoC family dehydratase [Nitrososphaerota archaeon]|nr:MaoC family dehydratase [Nitrososphaerota archaeon]
MFSHKEDGPFYEDFTEGAKLQHCGGRTTTDADNIWFSLLTCNTNPIHINKEYAEANFSEPPFDGRLVVNSFLVLSTVIGLSVNETSKNGIMLGMSNLTVTNPTFAGDTISAESEVIGKRESNSHPSMGLVTVRTKGFKQGSVEVMKFERTFMVRRRHAKWK